MAVDDIELVGPYPSASRVRVATCDGTVVGEIEALANGLPTSVCLPAPPAEYAFETVLGTVDWAMNISDGSSSHQLVTGAPAQSTCRYQSPIISCAETRSGTISDGIGWPTCSFEGTCAGWTQAGSGYWTQGNSTPSSNTGAHLSTPANGGSYFMYLEANLGRVGEASYLVSPTFSAMSRASFSYHMYGATMGTLSVEAKIGSTWTRVWSRTGQQQPLQTSPWASASVAFSKRAVQLRFKGTRGSSWTGDMCVDMVSIKDADDHPFAVALGQRVGFSTCGSTLDTRLDILSQNGTVLASSTTNIQ